MNGKNNGKIEIRREVTIERIGSYFEESGIVKMQIAKEYDDDGALIEEKEISYARLSCGHALPPGAQCKCGKSYCKKCVEGDGNASVCVCCGHYVGKCCRVRSAFISSEIYCRQCRWFGWLVKLIRGCS